MQHFVCVYNYIIGGLYNAVGMFKRRSVITFDNYY